MGGMAAEHLAVKQTCASAWWEGNSDPLLCQPRQCCMMVECSELRTGKEGVGLSCKGHGSDSLFLLLLIVSCLPHQQMPLIMHEMINLIKSGIVNLCRAESCFHYIMMSIKFMALITSLPCSTSLSPSHLSLGSFVILP